MTDELDRKMAAAKYGPWAVVAGGSDGTGEAYVRQLAALGLNVMIVSRREDVLNALADDIRAKHGVETRVLVQDLMAPDAAANMLQASADLDVGLYVSNAGVDGTGSSFFDLPSDRWKRMIAMNVTTVMEAIHGFGNRLRKRGRGGFVIMGSTSGLGGVPFLSMYSATKAFEMVLVEALWAELARDGVDMLGVVAPAMNTPMFQRNITGEDFKLGTVFEPDDVARQALASLGRKPLLMFPSGREVDPEAVEKQRYHDLLGALEAGKSFFKKGEKIDS